MNYYEVGKSNISENCVRFAEEYEPDVSHNLSISRGLLKK